MFLEQIVGLFWMLAFQLDAQIWSEWIDSESNWSDGVSRDFQDDVFARDHNFELEPVSSITPEWSESWPRPWAFSQRGAKEQALEL